MEDPYGSDPNDLPTLRYHDIFCRALHDMLKTPWSSKDTFLHKPGEPPKPETKPPTPPRSAAAPKAAAPSAVESGISTAGSSPGKLTA